MMTAKHARRALVIFLALSLTLPSPALALRDQEVVEKKPEVLNGLEEALLGDFNRLVQLASAALGFPSSSVTHTTALPAVIPPWSAAGLEEAESLLSALTHFQTEGDFTHENSTVRIIPYGHTNRTFLIERNDGIKLVGFRLAGIWNFPVLDRNHYRFEKKQATALQAKILPEGWKTFQFLERKDVGSKLYQDEQGNYWRFMPFTEGRVILSVDEIPAGKRLDAVERFSRVLVRFRRMLETLPEEQFEDSAPNFQSTTYHLGHYDRVLAGTEVEVSLSSNLTRKIRMEPSRLTGQGSNGDFATRNKDFQAKVARYRFVMESALKSLRSVVTHGDPQLGNVFWEVDVNGDWLPLGMGDLDYIQLGHETLDIADAVRAFSFIGGLDADPDNLVLLRNVVETMIESWLDEIGQVYGEAERQRLEPFVYPSAAAIYFRLAVRFYDSFLTGDSHFEGPIRYGKPVPDPGKYLRRAEIQMSQAETFIRAFKDKPGMANLATLITQADMKEPDEITRGEFLKILASGVGATQTEAYRLVTAVSGSSGDPSMHETILFLAGILGSRIAGVSIEDISRDPGVFISEYWRAHRSDLEEHGERNAESSLGRHLHDRYSVVGGRLLHDLEWSGRYIEHQIKSLRRRRPADQAPGNPSYYSLRERARMGRIQDVDEWIEYWSDFLGDELHARNAELKWFGEGSREPPAIRLRREIDWLAARKSDLERFAKWTDENAQLDLLRKGYRFWLNRL